MKIKRVFNGEEVEIELTSDEVFQAYLEKEAEFDLSDAEVGLDKSDEFLKMKDDYHLSEKQVSGVVERVADEMRRDMDKNGTDFDFARDEAIGKVLKEVAVELEKGEVNDLDGLISDAREKAVVGRVEGVEKEKSR